MESAELAADTAKTLAEKDNVYGALLALNTCAIYTVGAELIGRLDNMHFSGEGFKYDQSNQFNFNGFFETRIKDDISDKKQDSNDDSASTEAAGGTEGE
jgi:hypothetical protein